MRSKHRTIGSTEADQEAQYCILCEAYMLFERVESEDLPADDPITEWICVQCGSAVFLDPPAQALEETG